MVGRPENEHQVARTVALFIRFKTRRDKSITVLDLQNSIVPDKSVFPVGWSVH